MSPMCPYMALDTTKIHTPITLGVRPCTKPLVFKLRRRRPCGCDSHRPLHFPAGLRIRRDTRLGSTRWSCGKALGTDVDLATVSCPHISPSCPTIHTYSHTRRVRKITWWIPTHSAPQRWRSHVAGLGPWAA